MLQDIAFDGDEITQVCEFPYHELDPDPNGHDAVSDAADELHGFLLSTWADDLTETQRRFEKLCRRYLNANDRRLSLAQRGLKKILNWCECKKDSPEARFRKFAAACTIIDAKIVNGRTLKDLAEQIGVTKALMSKLGLDFRKAFAVSLSQFRSDIGRENMRAARLAQVDDTGHVIARNKTARSFDRAADSRAL